MSKLKNRFALAGLGAALICAAALAATKSKPGEKRLPQATKEVYVLVEFVSNATSDLVPAIERGIGEDIVAKRLTQMGYKVTRVLSFEELTSLRGTPERSFIDAMSEEPNRDSARVLFVVVQAFKSGELMTTDFSLLDAHVYGLVDARRNSVPASRRYLWEYEAIPMRSTTERSLENLERRLHVALRDYDTQFNERMKTGQYPDLYPR